MSTEKICPRCNVNKLHPMKTKNALSRRDNKTIICNSCGTEEAVQDMFIEHLLPSAKK